MQHTWEPMWKCRSCRQSVMPRAASWRTTATISRGRSPNLAFSPEVDPQWPSWRVDSFARTPSTGRTPIRCATRSNTPSSCRIRHPSVIPFVIPYVSLICLTNGNSRAWRIDQLNIGYLPRSVQGMLQMHWTILPRSLLRIACTQGIPASVNCRCFEPWKHAVMAGGWEKHLELFQDDNGLNTQPPALHHLSHAPRTSISAHPSPARPFWIFQKAFCCTWIYCGSANEFFSVNLGQWGRAGERELLSPARYSLGPCSHCR